MHIAMGLLGIVLAGCLIWLLLIEAGNRKRSMISWAAWVAALSALSITALMLAAFLFVGGPFPLRK